MINIFNQSTFWVFEFPVTLFFFYFGAIFGSFGKVILDRLPLGESLASPSKCPVCDKYISFFSNLPLFSYLFLRGKGKCCGSRIPMDYFLWEFGTGLFFGAMAFFMIEDLPLAFVLSVTFWAFSVITVYDWNHLEIPDIFTIGGVPCVLIAAFFVPSLLGYPRGFDIISGYEALIASGLGMLLSSGILLWCAIYVNGYFSWRMGQEVESIGFGDVKLMGLIGALLGFQGGVFVLVAGQILFFLFYFTGRLFPRICVSPGKAMLVACDAKDMVTTVDHYTELLKLSGSLRPSLPEVVGVLKDRDSLFKLNADAGKPFQSEDADYIENLMAKHSESLDAAVSVGAPMPLGPSLILAAVLYWVFARDLQLLPFAF